MENLPRASIHPRKLSVLWLAISLLCALSLSSQTTTAPPSAAQSSTTQPSATHAVVVLDGPWRFANGDDPRWADPAFDDSAWATVDIGKALSDQEIDTYSGFAWYRLRLDPQQMAAISGIGANSTPELLVTGYSMGQLDVYVNGVEAGHTKGMTDSPRMYESPPFAVPLSGVNLSAPVALEIRAWAGPDVKIQHGLLAKVELGSTSDINDRLAMAAARQWNDHAIAPMVVSFLFLCVALLGLALYLAQRHHAEYLWLCLLCLTVSIRGVFDVLYGLAQIPLSVYDPLTAFSGRVFMAVTVEFVLRFTEEKSKRPVRIFQVCVLLLPFVYLIQLEQIYAILSVTAEIVFCALVCVLLFRAWRAGRPDAGVMLLPFFLAATADSANSVLDYAGYRHWLPMSLTDHRFHFGPIEFDIGTIAYAVFLISLMAVILYRFVRVSQEEQKSTAEIAAARSVQAMLIPTKLPSNKYFMLESAYFPVNGVGGDFFQVLPVEDGSIKLVVGDVSGKGLQAAMNASTLVGAFRNELSHDPATILNHLNNVMLGADAPARGKDPDALVSFATCLCARIFRDGTMELANAGHLSPYRDGREMEVPPGLPLGVIPGIKYEKVSIRLEAGMRLIFLSDGVVEAANPEGELFGFERTQQVSNEGARYIAQTAKRFGQTDDITVISVYIASCEEKKVERELVEV
ncbi:MAG TPA: SpoIIE family protein phosphatase [Terracidiphilus sp.]|nr:SpoIIE family protein phosphatase [Terracidiphilus sp.]